MINKSRFKINYKNSLINLKSISLLFYLYRFINRKRKLQLLFLILVMILSGFSELISLSLVIPFLTVITNPDILSENKIIQKYLIQNFDLGIIELIIILTLFFAVSALFSGIIRILNYWLNGRVSALITSDLSVKGFDLTINQPYIEHINNNSSSLILASTKQFEVFGEVVRQILQFLSSIFIAVFLILGIFLIDWKMTIYFISILIPFYIFIGIVVRKRLVRNSVLIADSTSNLVKIVQDIFGYIRDITLDGSQERFTSNYKNQDIIFRLNSVDNYFYRAFPRYALETIGLIAISLSAAFLVILDKNKNLIPTLGFIALAAQRLLPIVQVMFSSWAFIKGTKAEQFAIFKILNQKVSPINLNKNKLFYKNEIKLQSVSFKYNQSSQYVLKNINLSIKKGEKIGIIGETGGGKTTLIDILMGLLKPNSGKMFIDNNELYEIPNSENLFKWRNLIAHVPQDIFLNDKSIAENIAIGCDYKDIDIKRVIRASKKAKIHDFISKTKYGYKQRVGERGILLSGGQRQRLAIARALYKDKKLLIFDEATSALDNFTESSIINTIDNLKKDITIIIIAHRISSLKNCDRIFELKNGKLIEN